MSEYFQSTSPTNLILSSLVSEFWQRIQILDFFEGGGGGGGVDGEAMSTKLPYKIYTRYIGMASSTESYSLMKICLTVFEIEGIVSSTIKRR